MNDFEEEMKELVKSYFPDAEWPSSVVLDHPLGLGPDPAENKIPEYDCYHVYFGEEGVNAKKIVIFGLKNMRFFKAPDKIFWRSAGSGEDSVFGKIEIVKRAHVRFILGYKLCMQD